MKSGCRMIRQVICRYASVFCTLSFAIRCCHGSLEKEVSIFFDFFSKLDVGVLFVKVVVKSIKNNNNDNNNNNNDNSLFVFVYIAQIILHLVFTNEKGELTILTTKHGLLAS